MNVLFLTQSTTLKVFYDLMQQLKEPLQLEKIGFFISDSAYFLKFRKDTPEIESGKYILVKEWEVTLKAEKSKPDIEKLKKYQEQLKTPSLWGAVVCDRRIMWGNKFTFRQDYKPMFNHEQVMSILTEIFSSVEELFNRVKPDFVVSFICTTMGEFANYLVARSRNIPFLNLRPTRIQNYMTFGTTIHEPSEIIHEAYKQYMDKNFEDQWIRKASQYLDFVRQRHARYEGVFLPTQRPPQVRSIMRLPRKKAPLFIFKRLIQKMKNIFEEEYHFRFAGPRCDRHLPGALLPMVYRKLLNPWLVRKIDLYFSKKYISKSELQNSEYVFFPLHTEPEVSLLVYSKSYLNQIEVLRNIAYSLPAGMILVVKEHPAARGKRPLSYYQKIEEIFNVRFADPTLNARFLIVNSRLVATIASSVGLEAVLLGKPVITFGQTPYEILPPHMVRRIKDLNNLDESIADLLQNHSHDEKALINYVAAVMSRSVAIDFYTTLLERKAQFSLDDNPDRQKDMSELAKYTMSILENISAQKNK
jgi:hypothetical protein